MAITPTSSFSLSIGTTSTVRAPAASASATGPGLTFEVGFLHSEVGNVLQLSRCGNAAKWILRAKPDYRVAPPQLVPCLRGSVHRRHPKGISVVQQEVAELGVANARRVFQHGLEDGGQLSWRAADDAQHLGGRRLLLQRLAQIVSALPQLVEQPRVLNGDDCLAPKASQQLDLFLGERPHLRAVDADLANELVLLQHGHVEHGASASNLEEGKPMRIGNVTRLVPDVGNLNSLFRPR